MVVAPICSCVCVCVSLSLSLTLSLSLSLSLFLSFFIKLVFISIALLFLGEISIAFKLLLWKAFTSFAFPVQHFTLNSFGWTMFFLGNDHHTLAASVCVCLPVCLFLSFLCCFLYLFSCVFYHFDFIQTSLFFVAVNRFISWWVVCHFRVCPLLVRKFGCKEHLLFVCPLATYITRRFSNFPFLFAFLTSTSGFYIRLSVGT